MPELKGLKHLILRLDYYDNLDEWVNESKLGLLTTNSSESIKQWKNHLEPVIEGLPRLETLTVLLTGQFVVDQGYETKKGGYRSNIRRKVSGGLELLETVLPVVQVDP